MIETKLIKITPDYARELLSRNKSNRKLSSKHVLNLSSSMSRGEWQLNGESIKIAECGTLLDGQHRLSAIVKNGSSVDMFVVFGLPIETFHTINVGAKARTASDVLSIAGEDNHAMLAAGARIFRVWELNKSDPDFKSSGISVSEIEGVIARNPELRIYASCKKRELKKMLGAGSLCFLGYVFSCISKPMAESFFDGLSKGTGLESGSPVLMLRDRLMVNSVSSAKLTRGAVIALSFKAFNAHVLGRKIGILRYSESEKFPILISEQ